MNKPLVNAMLKYLQDGAYPLMATGHKGGRGLDTDFAELLQKAGQTDAFCPEGFGGNLMGVLAEAQKLAAQLYGSDACFWCADGTDKAIMAMILGAVSPDDKVLVARNSPVSVFNALIMAHAKPVCFVPELNEKFGIYTQIRPKEVESLLISHKGIKAMVLTSPNCYGVAADVASIAYVCQKHGVLLLVDETYGAHLGFTDKLPLSAMRSDADACVQGTFKSLGALTQAGMLHIKSKNIDVQRVVDAMAFLTTPNPNYLLLASLDVARAQLEEKGTKMMETALVMADKVKTVVKVAGLKVLESKDVQGFELDGTKILVNLDDIAVNGLELARLLRQEDILVELADERNLLMAVTYADDNADFYDVLIRLRKVFMNLKKTAMAKVSANLVPPAETVMDLDKVFYATKEKAFLPFSMGKISAEFVTFYPMGMPVLLPGERITAEVLDYIEKQKSLRLKVSGAADKTLETIRVVRE